MAAIADLLFDCPACGGDIRIMIEASPPEPAEDGTATIKLTPSIEHKCTDG